MSQELFNHSPDLKRLRNEGYEIEVRGGYALVHHVPYVNSKREINYGTLISNLTLSGDKTTKPDTHVMHFLGEQPCHNDGSEIKALLYPSNGQDFGNGVTCSRSFSNRPDDGYKDYYEKFTTYIKVLMNPARSIDSSVRARTYRPIESPEDSVFHYLDTNSSRAEIGAVSSKLEHQKIGIVGVGGTGSYILDLVAKTPVAEIHLFDGDEFLQHNAFRAPGAIHIDQLREQPLKVDYLAGIYGNMHKHIHPHPYYIDETNIGELLAMDFVFICIDKGDIKRILIPKLIENQKIFIDVGMGIELVDDTILGILRATTGTPDKYDHIPKRVSFADGGDNEYSTNIQIADLNALNATIAVIKWKKICRFYQDRIYEHHSQYSINDGVLCNEDC